MPARTHPCVLLGIPLQRKDQDRAAIRHSVCARSCSKPCSTYCPTLHQAAACAPHVVRVLLLVPWAFPHVGPRVERELCIRLYIGRLFTQGVCTWRSPAQPRCKACLYKPAKRHLHPHELCCLYIHMHHPNGCDGGCLYKAAGAPGKNTAPCADGQCGLAAVVSWCTKAYTSRLFPEWHFHSSLWACRAAGSCNAGEGMLAHQECSGVFVQNGIEWKMRTFLFPVVGCIVPQCTTSSISAQSRRSVHIWGTHTAYCAPCYAHFR